MALRTPEEFVQSLADLHLQIYLFGEKIDDYVDHPLIRPSINCIADDLRAGARSRSTRTSCWPRATSPARRVNRFTHIHQSTEDLVQEGQDAAPAGPADRLLLPALRRHGRLQRPVLGHLRDGPGQRHRTTTSASGLRAATCRTNDLVVDGAMTDAKGDRGLRAARAGRPRPVRARRRAKRDDGIVVRGAKAHQTGRLQLARDPRHAHRRPCARTTRTTPSASPSRPTPRASPTSTAASPATRASWRAADLDVGNPRSAARRR